MGLSNSLPNAVLQQGVCTSTTRPAAPYVGQTVYETDTGSFLVYYGATTGWKPPWNAPWGAVSVANNIAPSSATSGTTELVIATGTTFTAIANRYYQITFSTTSFNAGGTDAIFEVRLRKDNATGTELHLSKLQTGAPYYRSIITVSTVFTTSAGSFTPVATFLRNFGSGTLQTIDKTALIVTDIGPSTSAAPTS